MSGRDWQRPRADAYGLLAWKAGRVAVERFLREDQVPALLGPQRGGWTVVRVLRGEGGRVLEPRSRAMTDLAEDGARTLEVPGMVVQAGSYKRDSLIVCTGRPPRLTATIHTGELDAAERRSWSKVLEATDSEASLGTLVAAVTRARRPPPGADEAAQSAHLGELRRVVAGALDLPPHLLDWYLVGDPYPRREVLFVPPGSSVTSPPSSLLTLGDRGGFPLRATWTRDGFILVPEPTDGPRSTTPLTQLITPGTLPGWALLLWRQGESRGYTLYRKGAVFDRHWWTTDWQPVPLAGGLRSHFRAFLLERLTPPEGDARALRKVFPAASADPDEIRAVLRRGPGPEVLERFCAVLDLPEALSIFVEAPERASFADATVMRRSALATLAAITPKGAAVPSSSPRPDTPTPQATGLWVIPPHYHQSAWRRAGRLAAAVLAVLGFFALEPGSAPNWLVEMRLVLPIFALVFALEALLPNTRPRHREPVVAQPSDDAVPPDSAHE